MRRGRSSSGRAPMLQPNLVYVTYIGAPIEKVWEAITTSAFTTRYFFGRSVESDWKAGSEWILRMPRSGRRHEDPAANLGQRCDSRGARLQARFAAGSSGSSPRWREGRPQG